jgi:hypothetical protein
MQSLKSKVIFNPIAIVSCDQFVTLLRFMNVYNFGLKFKAFFPFNMAPLQPLKDFKFQVLFSCKVQ